MFIIELILTLIIFFITKYVVFIVTENGLPKFINYQPYSCFRCMGFWTLLFIYINSIICFNAWYMGILGVIITILDVIALTIDERNNTVSISNEDLDI